MKTQTYTSAATSINATRLPAVYSRLDPDALRMQQVLDYGCGRYTGHIRAHVEGVCDGEYLPYDLYNQPAAVNVHSRREAARGDVGLSVICSNVLNVIDSTDVVKSIVDELAGYAADGAAVYVTVYEGDRSGVGRATGADSYQRNEKVTNYLQFFPANFVVKKGVITNRADCIK